MDKTNIVLLIPALNPDEKLLKLVDGLLGEGFKNFFVVNDGSDAKCLPIFEQLKSKCEDSVNLYIFTHYKNLGKGRALKNAFNQIYTVFPNFECVVTLDADGQHAVEDIIKVADSTLAHPNSLVLGSRKFGEGVPFRSKFGNILTRNVMKVLCGISVRDTQTGLRGFSKQTLAEFLDIPGERYEYEMNVLLATKEKSIPLVEETIQTIYLDDNKSSHFNPIKDSIRIYSLFFKYIVSSLLSFVVDIVMFALFVKIFKNISYAMYIYIATVLARILSSYVNYLVNKNGVFKAKNRTKTENIKSLIGYYILVVINVIVSSLCVNAIVKCVGWNETATKLLVDMVLFVVNFVIQREFIFKNKKRVNK